MSIETSIFSKFKHLQKFDVTDLELLEQKYLDLINFEISNKFNLEEFLAEFDLIEEHVVTEMSESFFMMTIDVSDIESKNRKSYFDQKISPLSLKCKEQLNNKLLKAICILGLEDKYQILVQNLKMDIKIYSAKNEDILKRINIVSDEITELQGKLTIVWDGVETPLMEVYPHLKSTDRDLRKRCYEAVIKVESSQADLIDDKFDELLKLRHELATNAGFESYTKYRFAELRRFEWGEDECFEFHKAVKEYIIPQKAKLNDQRKCSLNIGTIRPYDLSVDIKNREPIKIFESGQSHLLIDGVEKIIEKIDSELLEFYRKLKNGNMLDLESRPNKAPAGYMVMFPVYKEAAVFLME